MKIAGIVSYVGNCFSGFQRQKNAHSVQDELENALSFLMNKPVQIKAAGRTDAGVSATGQVFSFISERELDLERFRMQLNRRLPSSICVRRLLVVPDGFDPRHSAMAKQYVYRFYLGDKDPFKKDTHTRWRKEEFDLDIFKSVLQVFLGKHDFSNYTSKKEDKDDFIRIIDKIDVVFDEQTQIGYITFLANGFMTYQIRYMVGMAFEVSRGRRTYEEAIWLLDHKPRRVVSCKAAPEGLCLERVIYEEKLGL